MEQIEQLNKARKERLLALKARVQSDEAAAAVREEVQQQKAENGTLNFTVESHTKFVAGHPLFSNLHKLTIE